MQSALPQSQIRARRQSRRIVAVGALLAAVLTAANAQTPVTAEIFVVPVGTSPPPVAPPKGLCTPRGSVLLCVKPEPVDTGNVAPGTPVAIQWNITSPGLSFVKNKGIDIKNRKDWKINEDSPTRYTATNKKENGAPIYKYEINVMNGTAALEPWDPTIRN